MSEDNGNTGETTARTKYPRYIEFHRYEGRVTRRQWRRLTAARERLTEENRKGRIRNKDLKTERMTENSLIRIAVDVLFENFAEGIHGHTEKELYENIRQVVRERLEHADESAAEHDSGESDSATE